MDKKSEFAYEYKHIAKLANIKEEANKFCEKYKNFLNASKTERECVKTLKSLAEYSGYKEFVRDECELTAGDKYYVVNREKCLVLITIGKLPLDSGINFVMSHIDSPRLDLKPNPVYEDTEISYFKTHYYGGIRKYQWPVTPLSMHGRIIKEDGTFVDICYGEKDDEPKFIISDLLPHLSQDQDKRSLNDGIRGEELNIIIGSIPIEGVEDDYKEPIKANVLKIMNDLFGIKERDFSRAEIEFVPANKATDIGFDKSLIAAYGQDDKVCAYASFMAEIENVEPVKTSIAVFTDKEEIGSEGVSGMISNYLFDIVEDLAYNANVLARDIYRKSICISSDVNSAFDPSFPDPFEKRNASMLNHGIVVSKYTGHRGKVDASDASAELVYKVTKLLDDKNVIWQIGELGKVDIGGGGTIAKYVAQRNIDTIDVGVPVLAMHSPYEVTAKLDIYETYLAYKAFLLNNN